MDWIHLEICVGAVGIGNWAGLERWILACVCLQAMYVCSNNFSPPVNDLDLLWRDSHVHIVLLYGPIVSGIDVLPDILQFVFDYGILCTHQPIELVN